MNDSLRSIWERRAGILLVLGALIGGGFYYESVRDQEAQARCQTAYNVAFTEVLRIRSELTGQRQDAVDDVLQGVAKFTTLPQTEDPEVLEERTREFTKLFKDYTEAIEAYKRSREANPLPLLPPDC